MSQRTELVAMAASQGTSIAELNSEAEPVACRSLMLFSPGRGEGIMMTNRLPRSVDTCCESIPAPLPGLNVQARTSHGLRCALQDPGLLTRGYIPMPLRGGR